MAFALLRQPGVLTSRRLGVAAQPFYAGVCGRQILAQCRALHGVLGHGGGQQRDLVSLRLVELADGVDLLGEPRRLDGLPAERHHIGVLAGADARHLLLDPQPLDGVPRTQVVTLGEDLLHGERHLQLQALAREPQRAAP